MEVGTIKFALWTILSCGCIYIVSGATEVQAAIETPTSSILLNQDLNPSSLPASTLSVAALEDRLQHPENAADTGESLISAGPDNFNPELQIPEPQPEQSNPNTPSVEKTTPVFKLEKLQTDFRNDHSNFGEQNQLLEQTAQFQLKDGNKLTIRTGVDTFDQRNFDSVVNVPIQMGWEGKLGSVTLAAAAGVDVFDRLPVAPNLDLRADLPISPSATISALLEYGPYKFNAQTLENEISAWRFGPNFFWQIDRNSSFFTLLRLGAYSDGNFEVQSFSRLERKIGQFFLALNLFTWSYSNDVQDRQGYFSPPDFLVYNGEVGWEGNIFQFLRCRLTTNLGQQRLNGKIDPGSTSQARCTVKFSPNTELDLGYAFSNVQSRGEGNDKYRSESFSGQLRITF